MVLPEDHPSVVEGRSRFVKSAGEKRATGRVLITGHNQRKIGKRVAKGRWSGMDIYTLTLEERRTCPRSCSEWRSCYGNNMPWSIRRQPGNELETKIEQELGELQTKHPRGFIVRLHILGDFYSVSYVKKWEMWLSIFPALRVFGYTARADEIGTEVRRAQEMNPDRFCIRSSGAVMNGMPAAIVVDDPEQAEAIVCPVQTGKTDCCATCALCWSTPKTIAFLQH